MSDVRSDAAVSWSYVGNACSVLYFGSYTLEAYGNAENMWGQATTDVGNAYLHDKYGPSPDPKHPEQGAANIWLDTFLITDAPGVDGFVNSPDFINPAFFNQWCIDTVTKLLTCLSKNYDDKKSPIDMNAVQQMSSEIQATSGADNAARSTEAQACGSIVSNASQAATPAANAADSVIGVIANGASTQQSISA